MSERCAEDTRNQSDDTVDEQIDEKYNFVEGKGVYVGITKINDRDGNFLGEFDVYAAPEDMQNREGRKLLLNFNKVAKRVASIKNYHGHDGFNHKAKKAGLAAHLKPFHLKPDEAIYQALWYKKYDGEWFIPTLDILANTLYENRDHGDLRGTFTEVSSSTNNADNYMSCTVNSGGYVHYKLFSTGGESRSSKYSLDGRKSSTRLVRLELRP